MGSSLNRRAGQLDEAALEAERALKIASLRHKEGESPAGRRRLTFPFDQYPEVAAQRSGLGKRDAGSADLKGLFVRRRFAACEDKEGGEEENQGVECVLGVHNGTQFELFRFERKRFQTGGMAIVPGCGTVVIFKLAAEKINILVAEGAGNLPDAELGAFDESAGVDHLAVD